MSKNDSLSAKEVAAMCNMHPKNFRKHLRENDIKQDRKETRYAFTSKQAEKIVAEFTASDASDDDAIATVVKAKRVRKAKSDATLTDVVAASL
jgi:phage antirepressor YoqD-like protein